jgi:uncharacterized protein YdcH (DUF465 family)
MPVDNATRKRNRLAQYNLILQNGVVADNPCEYCSSRCIDCVMDSKSRNCAECTRRGRRCVRKLHSDEEWQRVLRESAKLDAEIEAVEKQQMQLMAKMLRLRKQKQLFKNRSGRMLNHDSFTMEQLDAEDPLNAEDLAELDRLADERDTQILAATSENPTLTQMFGPLSPSTLEGMDLSFLAGDSSGFGTSLPPVAQESVSPLGNTSGRAGGSPSGSR